MLKIGSSIPIDLAGSSLSVFSFPVLMMDPSFDASAQAWRQISRRVPPWWLLAYTSSLDLCPVIVAYRLLSNVCCRPFRRKPLGFQIRSVEGIPVWHMQSSWTLDSRPNPITRGQFVLAVKCVKTSGIPLWHAHVKPNVNIINFWIINGLIQDYFESKAKNMDILKHGTRDGTKKLQLQCMQKRVYVYAHTCYMHVYF